MPAAHERRVLRRSSPRGWTVATKVSADCSIIGVLCCVAACSVARRESRPIEQSEWTAPAVVATTAAPHTTLGCTGRVGPRTWHVPAIPSRCRGGSVAAVRPGAGDASSPPPPPPPPSRGARPGRNRRARLRRVRRQRCQEYRHSNHGGQGCGGSAGVGVWRHTLTPTRSHRYLTSLALVSALVRAHRAGGRLSRSGTDRAEHRIEAVPSPATSSGSEHASARASERARKRKGGWGGGRERENCAFKLGEAVRRWRGSVVSSLPAGIVAPTLIPCCPPPLTPHTHAHTRCGLRTPSTRTARWMRGAGSVRTCGDHLRLGCRRRSASQRMRLGFKT